MTAKIFLSIALSLGMASISCAAHAADNLTLPTQKQLNLAAADRIAAAANQYATEHGWTGSIAVVDTTGYPIVVRRMDGATAISAELAIKKARTSMLFGVPTVNFENRINDNHPALLALDMATLAGGQPIVVDGKVIGAVGVSTAVGAHDDPIASAASHALDGAH